MITQYDELNYRQQHPPIPRLFALNVLLALAAVLAISQPVPAAPAAVPAQTTVDYDAADDNLIDIANHAQLNAIRWDLDGNGVSANAGYATASPNAATTMGCASIDHDSNAGAPDQPTCRGYELVANIDFDADAYWNGGAGWDPIGDLSNRYTTAFKGNRYIIDNLFINRSTSASQGLFARTNATARIESLGVTNVNITEQDSTAILVCENQGEIIACFTTGSVAGRHRSARLIAYRSGSSSNVRSSYSTTSVNGQQNTGGLVGSATGGSITNSYATGRVSSTGGHSTVGGLVGSVSQFFGGVTVTTSYYDSTTTGCVSGGYNGCTGSAGSAGGTSKATTQIQTPTGYTGDYSDWNANIDGVTGNDDP